MKKVATCRPTGFPVWSRDANFRDYGGHDEKEASDTEGDVPYAARWYREVQSMRGSAFSTKPGTLVDCENVAIARLQASLSRTADKVRNNAVPGRSDEKLEDWVAVLGIPHKPTDRRWQLRDRAAAHYKAVKGPTLTNVIEALQDLLGDVLVSVTPSAGTSLANPPSQTFWPGGTPGPSPYDMGGGAWLSERAYLSILVQQPAGMSIAEFVQLLDVQMFALLDRMLPGWMTWTWAVSSSGFLLDISDLDLDGLTPT